MLIVGKTLFLAIAEAKLEYMKKKWNNFNIYAIGRKILHVISNRYG